MNSFIPILFFAFILVTIVPLILGHDAICWCIQKKRLKKGEIKEYTIVERLENHAVTEAEKIIGVSSIDYIVSDEHGNRYPIHLYSEHQVGTGIPLRKRKDGSLDAIIKNAPEPYSWIALICGFVLTIMNSIMIVYSFQHKNAFFNWWQILFILLGIVAGIVSIYLFYQIKSVYNEKNAVNSQVVGYGWENTRGVAGQGETIRTRRYYMYVKAVVNGKNYYGIGAEVSENGKIERKYPVGSMIQVYYTPNETLTGYASRIGEQKYQSILQAFLPLLIGIIFVAFGVLALL